MSWRGSGWALGLVLCGCGGDDDGRPPPLAPEPPAHPLSCAEIQQGALREDEVVEVGGSAAPCAAEGLECPLAAAPACDAGARTARCVSGTWTASCAAG